MVGGALQVGSGSVPERPVVLVSNRGPLSFDVRDGELVARRGAGGLVSGLAPLVAGTDTRWLAAAISEGDRLAAERGALDAEGFHLRLLALDAEQYRLAYDVVCNATLWFLHHGLFDLPRRPVFDRHWREAWDAYREVNRTFASAVAQEAPEGAAVLVQDYHLTLLAAELRGTRPDLQVVHFSHTPFAGPELMRVLPTDIATEMLTGLTAHHACGFHCARWADAFVASCRSLLDVDPNTFVAPLGPDPDDIRGVAASGRCQDALRELDELVGNRRLVVRVDRMEPSKNLLRGFEAFDELLDRHPALREQVIFGAFCYPSREALPEYVAYRSEVEAAVSALNAKWATPGWQPVWLDTSDDFPRSVAALRRYDVLLVNPIRDGLNLVAKEGPLVNERDGLVVLSTEAGVWDELAGTARGVNPFDVSATADALAEALAATPEDRRDRSAELRRRAGARTPADWLGDLVSAAG